MLVHCALRTLFGFFGDFVINMVQKNEAVVVDEVVARYETKLMLEWWRLGEEFSIG